MTTGSPRVSSLSTSLRSCAVLLSVLLTPLVIATGCSTVEEAAQEVQNEMTSACSSEGDNFEEDWPRIEQDQSERPTHKALAYAKSTDSGCFAWGYTEDFDSRQEAAEQALANCRKFRREAINEVNESFGACTLYSVNGESQ